MDKQSLIDFEDEVKELFLQKRILSPVHLSRGNEEPLIEIFKEIRPEDWVFSTHRSHYHALLHGIDSEWLKHEILEGRSMHIMNAEHHFFSSSIVGGNLPIAVGVAMGIKMKGEKKKVFVFTGDMAAQHGSFHEAVKYARNHNLPVCFVIEDNDLSTNTPTRAVWRIKEPLPPLGKIKTLESWTSGEVIYYRHERKCEHVGVGQFVHF